MKPIICNSESVKAILDGRKTQDRRVIKPQPKEYQASVSEHIRYIRWKDKIDANPTSFPVYLKRYCPYGIPGDKLWVRETWNAKSIDGIWWRDFKGDLADKVVFNWNLYYKASNDECEKWLSPIYMPKDFSRITLEIKDVRVERVQDIKPIDIIAEGIYEPHYNYTKIESIAASLRWEQVWNSINAKKGFGWNIDPWLWVLEFEKL